MKKIYSIILTTVVCLAGFAACTHDYPVGEMARNISLDPTTVQAAAPGQTFDVAVTADGAWVADTPDWITVTPANGEGSQTVKVTVAPNDGGERTDKVQFYSAVGDVSSTAIDLESTPLAELTVTQAAGEGQGGGDNVISIADYLALGANTDSYIITGTITRVANTIYGNFDLTDETGTIYVYGLLNEDLEAQKCWKEKELALGDILTIQANALQFYEKDQIWEIYNAVYVSHSKSLFDLESDNVTLPKEGADFDIKAVVKGENVTADYDADWITFNGAEKDGENVTLHFTAAENPGSPRAAVINLSTTTAKGETTSVEFTVNQDGSIIDATVAEVLAAEDDPLVLYRMTGYISKVNNMSKGRIYVTDYTGTIYAFGTRVAEAADAPIDLTSLGLEEGDIVTIVGYKTTYVNGATSTIEIVGYVDDFKKVEAVTVEEFLAKEVSADKWYRLTGIVTKPNAEETAAGNKFDLTQYGNFRLVDETGRAYVFGVLTGFGQPNNKLFGTLGVAEGNEITIVGNRAEYRGAPQVGKAWYVSHREVSSAEPEIKDVTIATVNAAADDENVFYRVKGYISDVKDLSKGRVYLTDYTGTIYCFNLLSAKGGSSTNLQEAGVSKGDIVTAVGYKTTYVNGGTSTIELMGYMESFVKVEAVTVEEFLAKEVSTEKWYRLTGIVTKPNADETAAGNKFDLTQYGNFRLVDDTGRAYVYGVLTGLGQPNNKLFGDLGVAEGDEITIVGNRAEFRGAPQVGNAWYVSHSAPTTPEEPGSGITITDANLPTAYPTTEATFTDGDNTFYILNVANFGTGIQIKKEGGYIANKTEMPSEIKSITVNCHPNKTYYQGNLKVYAGSAEKPSGDALTGVLSEDGKSETFAVPAGCKFFKIVNESGYAVYLASIQVEL